MRTKEVADNRLRQIGSKWAEPGFSVVVLWFHQFPHIVHLHIRLMRDSELLLGVSACKWVLG